MIKDKDERTAYFKAWSEKNRKGNPTYRVSVMSRRYALKREVLTHYGLDGTLRCCWPGCTESDVDVLTLDHIDNDGNHDRRVGLRKHSDGLYGHLRLLGFPEGVFQTLCWNHQWKKEITRKRNEVTQMCA